MVGAGAMVGAGVAGTLCPKSVARILKSSAFTVPSPLKSPCCQNTAVLELKFAASASKSRLLVVASRFASPFTVPRSLIDPPP